MNEVKSRSRVNRLSANNVFSRRNLQAGALVVTAAFASSVLAKQPPATKAPVMAKATKHSSWFQIGKASWYGPGLRGHRTANGDVFNPDELTCAHRTLPLNSLIRVTNLLNQRTLLLRVTDRGPFVGHRILDISALAARKLGIRGIGKVRLETVPPPVPLPILSGEFQLAESAAPQMPFVTER